MMRKWGSLIVLVFGVALLSRCTTAPKGPEATQEGIEGISLEELQDSLGMEMGDLGSMERTFNSCSLPKPLRENQPCGTRHFTLVHFRVQCRNSIGTTQTAVTELDLKALRKNLEWIIGDYRGYSRTDSDGYGIIRVVSTKSLMKKRFVLKQGKTALGVQTAEVTRLIVPENWCD